MQNRGVLVLKKLNLLLRFVLELCLFGAAFDVGYCIVGPGVWGWALGFGLLLGVVVLWAVYMAPRSERRLTFKKRVIAELILFTSAVAGLLYIGQPTLAWVFAVAVVGNEILLVRWEK